jgi:flagellar basal-body rod protein FlgB
MVTAYRFGHGQLEAIMLSGIDQQLGTLRNASNLRAYRQEVLASNIANADTPNYKARDFDFSAALEDAKAGRAGFTIAKTSERHLSAQDSSGFSKVPAGVSLLYRTEYQANADGNTVNMDVERSAFAENAVQLESALTFIRGQLAKLQTAITGQ